MAPDASATDSSLRLPAGMWTYSFMFGKPESELAQHVSEGSLPVPFSLLVGIGVGGILTAIRLLLDVVVFKPLARKILGFPRSKEPASIPRLDTLCTKKPSDGEVLTASKLTGLSEEDVRDYISVRKTAAAKAKQINKFKESFMPNLTRTITYFIMVVWVEGYNSWGDFLLLRCKPTAESFRAAWRLVVYSGLVVFGLKVCWGKSWFRDPYLVWDDWPTSTRADGIEVYYHCALGVYWHLIAFQFWETRRSDFTQMLVHHLATLFLLGYSWLMSLARIGTLVMLCHDVSDIFMETAKLFNYAQKRFPWCHLAADGIFFIFAAVFGVSRLYVYPKYMILSVYMADTLSEPQRIFFCALLCTLLVLHVFWFYLIMRMLYMFVVHGVEEDIREAEDNATLADGPAEDRTGTMARGTQLPANGDGASGKAKRS